MKLRNLLLLVVLLALFAAPVQAWRTRVVIGVGVPVGPYYGPYYRGYYYPYGYPYGYPYPGPVVVSPPPVVVQQPPVVIGQTPPVVIGQTPPGYATQPAGPAPAAAMPQITNGSDQGVGALLGQLSHPDENVRRNAIIELGRMRADRAVDHLTAALGGDISPQVRDAAARSLAIIGSARAVPALTRAAQADNDRDVRRSAQYAIDIIRSQQR